MTRLTGLLLLLLAVPAAAQEHPSDPPPCSHAETTVEMRRCLSDELTRLDARRDSLEVRLRTAADSATLRRLHVASAAWAAYRDADCRVAAGAYEGGTFAPVVALVCRIERTRARVGILKKRLRDPVWAERIERDDDASASTADVPCGR